MEELTRRQVVVYSLVAVLVVGLGARYLSGQEAEPRAQASGARSGGVRVERERPAAATVHVAGAVRRPGVYRMRPGARVNDAVRRAGGATASADLAAVNLAAKVEDGRQVIVPQVAAAVGAVGAVGGATVAPGQPLNLNTATLEQLDTLDGVGPATAQKILDFREEQGGFGSVEDLGQVPGIGEKRLAALREKVRV